MSPNELESFQSRSFRLACSVVALYVKLVKTRTVPGLILKQFLSAGTSIGANLEEAQGAHSRSDLTAKFSIALKESRETEYWIRLMIATKLVPSTAFGSTAAEAGEMIAVLTVARRRLKEETGERSDPAPSE